MSLTTTSKPQAADDFAFILTDHYGWQQTENALVRTSFCDEERRQTWTLPAGSTTAEVEGAVAIALPGSNGTVWRMPTATVWEALATGIIRQVVQAATARRNYWAVVREVGRDGAFPRPERLLELGNERAQELGIAFAYPKLCRVAEWAVLVGAAEPRPLEHALELIDDASKLSGVGAWTCAVARWDVSCDPRHYPAGDFVVQLGAARLFPEEEWPRRPADFAVRWDDFTDGDHSLTGLALIAADHAGWCFLESMQDLVDETNAPPVLR